MLERQLLNETGAELQPPNALARRLSTAIQAAGPMRFDDWMRLALYDPQDGFYSSAERKVGKEGDFMTSVSVSELFGQLLAVRIHGWLDTLALQHPEGSLFLVEAGAHGGHLAQDILNELRSMKPAWWGRLQFHFIEPNPRLRRLQAEKLSGAGLPLAWHSDPAAFCRTQPSRPGVFYANELLDAFPVFRLGWDGRRRRWFEWRVAMGAGGFEWCRGDWIDVQARAGIGDPEQRFFQRLANEDVDAYAAVLPDGFTLECSFEAWDWWHQASRFFSAGWWMTLDYGTRGPDLLDPSRPDGTLRGYRLHRVAANPLADPGSQDLTAHVDWPWIQSAGEAGGLSTETVEDQSRFLVGAAEVAGWMKSGSRLSNPVTVRRFQSLIHPNQLGNRFQALVQNRGV